MKYLVPAIFVLLILGAGVWWYVDSNNTGFAVMVDTPHAGDVLSRGDKSTASWHTYNFRKINPEWISNVTIRVTLVPADQTPEQARNSGDIVVADDVSFTERGSVPFIVPSNLPAGEYMLKLNLYGVGRKDIPNQLWGLAYTTNGTFTIK